MEQLNEWIQDYWNRRSRAFSSVRQQELASSDALAWQRYIQQFLPAGRRLRILDIGTGPGFLAILMARCGHTVTAVDSSTGMIEEACRNAAAFGANVDFHVADALALPFADDQFDLILSRNLTWNLPDVTAAYTEWYRGLCPGGVLLNFDANYGPVHFTAAAEEEENVHHTIDLALLRECDDLKDALQISKECRPAWDLCCVESIGFKSCGYTRDIRPFVHTSPDMKYDMAPLFCLHSRKEAADQAAH